MRPRKRVTTGAGDLFRARLDQIINMKHELVQLAERIGQPALEEAFAAALSRASQIRSQQQRQRGWKLYSFHAPEVECIGKGKAPRALRVRRQSLDRHHQCPRPRWSVRAARHGVAGQSI